MKKSTWYKISALIPMFPITDGIWESAGWPTAEVFCGVYLILFIGFCIFTAPMNTWD